MYVSGVCLCVCGRFLSVLAILRVSRFQPRSTGECSVIACCRQMFAARIMIVIRSRPTTSHSPTAPRPPSHCVTAHVLMHCHGWRVSWEGCVVCGKLCVCRSMLMLMSCDLPACLCADIVFRSRVTCTASVSTTG